MMVERARIAQDAINPKEPFMISAAQKSPVHFVKSHPYLVYAHLT